MYRQYSVTYRMRSRLHAIKVHWHFFSGKKILKCIYTKDVTTMEKRDMIIKTPVTIFNMQMLRKKSFLWKRLRQKDKDFCSCFFFFGYIFWRTLIPVILYISWGLIDNPYIILGQKIPRNLILAGFLSSKILSYRTSENKDIFTKVFLPNFFSCDCLS